MRFLLLSHKVDTEFVFDVDLALKWSSKNPVHYVQYTRTHICSVLECAGVDAVSLISANLAVVTGPDVSPQVAVLVQRLAAFPDMLADVVCEPAPYTVAFHLHDLAGGFHAFCNADRVLIGDEVVKCACLALLAVTRQVLHNELAVTGVSVP